jgi:uncharacterized phage-associated protein
VYIAHGWMLGLYGRPLIRDRVEAWRYGPVIPSVYQALKGYRSEPVTNYVAAPVEKYDSNEQTLVRQVYDFYKRFDGIELSKMTHMPGTPWYEAWENGGQNQPIPTEAIQAHYSQLARDRNAHKRASAD